MTDEQRSKVLAVLRRNRDELAVVIQDHADEYETDWNGSVGDALCALRRAIRYLESGTQSKSPETYHERNRRLWNLARSVGK